MVIRKVKLEQSATETYTSQAGLTLIGQCIRLSSLDTSPFNKQQLSGISHTDILKSYLSMACLGKSDFEAIENHRHDDYLKEVVMSFLCRAGSRFLYQILFINFFRSYSMKISFS